MQVILFACAKALSRYILQNMNTSRIKQISAIALPVMAGSLIESLYNLTDAFFLGKLGADEFGAPSVSFSIIFMMIVFASGLTNAGSTLIAQCKGKGDQERANFYLGQMTGLIFIVALVIMLLGLVLTKPILLLLQTPPSVLVHARVYMIIVFLGLPFMFFYFIMQAAYTAIGDTFTPLWIHLVAIGINVILDPLLIFGLTIPFQGRFLTLMPSLGVAGAAIATVISQGIASIFSFKMLVSKKRYVHLRTKNLKPDSKAYLLISKIGFPASIGDALAALGFTVLQGLVNHFGVAVIAAFGAGNKVMGLFDVAALGISQGSSTLVAQALGRKDVVEAKKIARSGIFLLLAMIIPLLSLSVIFGGKIIQFFVNDPEAMALGDIMFRIVAPSILLFDVFQVLVGVFKAAGDTKPVMVLSIMRLWLIRVPLAYFLAFVLHLGPISIWIGMFASNLIVALLGFFYYKHGSWLKALNPDLL